MKKLLLTTALMLCTIMASATEQFSGQGSGTASSPYEIKYYYHLYEVRNFWDQPGKYFRLDVDINMADYLEGLSWEAIGSEAEPFCGVFLGNGHRIYNMTINHTSSYEGLFGYIKDATIQDLTVEGTVSGGGYVGGIVGSSSGTNTIKNCSFNGDVTGSGSYVGGIAGNFTGSMTDMTHTGNVTGSGSYVGGIAGNISGSMTNMTHTGNTQGTGYVGGIVGYQTGNAITTATNTGNVTATSDYVGGIAGVANEVTSANSLGKVSGGYYTGGLIGEASGNVSNSYADGNVTGKRCTGGLIGRSMGTVSYCASKGDVIGTQYLGGLVGQGYSSISNSRHTVGEVKGTKFYVGGIVGHLTSGSVTSCFAYANITGTTSVGGIVGYYSLTNNSSPQIASSGYFGNISAQQYVGGILGQVDYTGPVTTEEFVLPTLNTYKTYGSSADDDKTYQETLTETDNVLSIYNCAAVGDVISTSSYAGGIIGKGTGGEYLASKSMAFETTEYDNAHKQTWYDRRAIDYYQGTTYYTYDYYYYYYENGQEHRFKSNQTINYNLYTFTRTNISVCDNYFSGNLKGTDNVGGVVGYMTGGTVRRNYSYAAIEGNQNVGGIVGNMQADLTLIPGVIASNVCLNSTINVTNSNGGKIYCYLTGDNCTIATTGASNINRTLSTTALVVNGITQDTPQSGSAQHGQLTANSALLRSYTSQGQSTGMGWDYDSGKEWTQLDTKSYPYKQWQTAPPTIQTGAEKNSTQLTGTCQDNGTVYVTIEGSSTIYEATCTNGAWSLTVPALKSGTLIRAWSRSPDKEQSYHTAIKVSSPGKGTEAEPWLIYDAYDLKGVGKAGYYKMMNDVDLTSWISANSATAGWPGVGTTGTGTIVFDGNKKKVTGLWCNTTTPQNGLFTTLQNATIKDLTVEVASGKQMKGSYNTAILAGQLTNSAVTNVTVKGSVSGTNNAAALIAYSEGNTISGCKVDGCTINSATALSQVAGMVAVSKNDNISNCTVNATVTTTGTTYSGSDAPWRGGVVAYLQNGTMTDCSFNGTVTFSENTVRVGAMVGIAFSSSLTNFSDYNFVCITNAISMIWFNFSEISNF